MHTKREETDDVSETTREEHTCFLHGQKLRLEKLNTADDPATNKSFTPQIFISKICLKMKSHHISSGGHNGLKAMVLFLHYF